MARILLGLAGLLAISSPGRLINAYPPDPGERVTASLNQSEDLPPAKAECKRHWYLDPPAHVPPGRTDGGNQEA